MTWYNASKLNQWFRNLATWTCGSI